MSLTMQRLLQSFPGVVLPVAALAMVGTWLYKDKAAAKVEAQTVQTVPGSESCAVTSGAPMGSMRVVCLTSDHPGHEPARLRLLDPACADCGPTRITEPAERVSGFAVTADGKSVLFASDAASGGRPGNFSLFRYDIAHGQRVELTPGESLDRDPPRVPRQRPDLAVYSARAQGESQTRIFVQPIHGDAPKLVYVDAEPGELVDVSDDGTRGIYRRFIAPDKSVYIAIDLQKRQS